MQIKPEPNTALYSGQVFMGFKICLCLTRMFTVTCGNTSRGESKHEA